jgi:hypothetical protein
LAVGTENDQTLFAITIHDPEDHNLCWHLREGADPDVFVDFGHWQVFEVSAVARWLIRPSVTMRFLSKK